MILLFYIALNLIALAIFLKIKKNLHILEIIVYWLLSSYLFQNFSALCYMNLKTLIIPEKLSYEFAHFLNRLVLFPLLMVLFLHFFLTLRTYLKKVILIIGSIFIFVGLEGLAHALDVLRHVHWRIWWSFAIWLVVLLTLIGFMTFFRKLLYKGSVGR